MLKLILLIACGYVMTYGALAALLFMGIAHGDWCAGVACAAGIAAASGLAVSELVA